MLVSVFQLLNDRLDCQLKTTESIVKAALCLHNFMIDEKINRGNNVPRQNVRQMQDLPSFEEILPDNVVDAHEILTAYFNSAEGQII